MKRALKQKYRIFKNINCSKSGNFSISKSQTGNYWWCWGVVNSPGSISGENSEVWSGHWSRCK